LCFGTNASYRLSWFKQKLSNPGSINCYAYRASRNEKYINLGINKRLRSGLNNAFQSFAGTILSKT
jgi:hypothetical protein